MPVFELLGLTISNLTRTHPANTSSDTQDSASLGNAAEQDMASSAENSAKPLSSGFSAKPEVINELAVVPFRGGSSSSSTLKAVNLKRQRSMDLAEENKRSGSQRGVPRLALAGSSDREYQNEPKVRIRTPLALEALQAQISELSEQNQSKQERLNELSQEKDAIQAKLGELSVALSHQISQTEKITKENKGNKGNSREFDIVKALAEERQRQLIKKEGDLEELSTLLLQETCRVEELKRELEMACHVSALENRSLQEECSSLSQLFDEEKNINREYSAQLLQLKDAHTALAERDAENAGLLQEQVQLRDEMQNLKESVVRSEEALRDKYKMDMTNMQNDFDARSSELSTYIARLQDEVARYTTLNSDLNTRNIQLEDERRAIRNQLEEKQAEHLAVVERSKADVSHLQQSLTTCEAESSQRILVIQQELSNLRERREADERVTSEQILALKNTNASLEARMAEQVEDMTTVNNELQQRCAALEDVVKIRDKAISQEEDMVLTLRSELSKYDPMLSRSLGSSAERNSPSRLSEVAQGKRKAIDPAALANALPATAHRLVSNKLLETINRGSGRRVTSQFPILEEEDFNRSRNHQILEDRRRSGVEVFPPILPPGASIRNSEMGATNRFFRVSTAQAPRMSTVSPNQRHTPAPSTPRRNVTPRQATPGPSNARQDTALAHAYQRDTSNESFGFLEHDVSPGGIETHESSGISDPVAQTIVLGMERVVKAIGDLHDDFLKNSNGSNTPPRSKSRYDSNPFKLRSPRKPRKKEHVDMMRDARILMNKMLGIKQDQDIVGAVQAGHLITSEEAEELSEVDTDDEKLAGNLVFMKPCWDALKCDYNATLAHLFTQHFVNVYPKYAEQEDEVTEHFNQRLGGLKLIISRHLPRNGETRSDALKRIQSTRDKELRDKRRTQRKHEGYYRRITNVQRLAEIDPSYQTVLKIISSLGLDGYSSDESCTEGYLVKNLPWRNRKLKDVIKRAVDANPTVNVNGNNLPGGQRRNRIYHSHPNISSTPAPRGLPQNLYDDVWFNSLSRMHQRALEAVSDIDMDTDYDMDDDF